MPLFDYACDNCGQKSELLITASSQPTCPECGSSRLNKLLPIVASPARNGSSSEQSQRPSGSCGSHCGCHPH